MKGELKWKNSEELETSPAQCAGNANAEAVEGGEKERRQRSDELAHLARPLTAQKGKKARWWLRWRGGGRRDGRGGDIAEFDAVRVQM